MAQIQAGDLDQRVRVRELRYDQDADVFSWEDAYTAWARAEVDAGRNLFSAVGIGARGVTFTLRKNARLTLYKSLVWRGQFCFPTAILDAEPGFMEVKAALCDTVSCRKDLDRAAPGSRFPGVLTEKYVGHEQEMPYGEVTRTLVLVTPKDVALAPGSVVSAGGERFRVLVPHELDMYKNEYEIRRVEDC